MGFMELWNVSGISRMREKNWPKVTIWMTSCIPRSQTDWQCALKTKEVFGKTTQPLTQQRACADQGCHTLRGCPV